jgi:hypothetical protein
MGLFVILAFVVALALLGPRYGVDSRPHRFGIPSGAGARGRDPSWWRDW